MKKSTVIQIMTPVSVIKNLTKKACLKNKIIKRKDNKHTKTAKQDNSAAGNKPNDATIVDRRTVKK